MTHIPYVRPRLGLLSLITAMLLLLSPTESYSCFTDSEGSNFNVMVSGDIGDPFSTSQRFDVNVSSSSTYYFIQVSGPSSNISSFQVSVDGTNRSNASVFTLTSSSYLDVSGTFSSFPGWGCYKEEVTIDFWANDPETDISEKLCSKTITLICSKKECKWDDQVINNDVGPKRPEVYNGIHHVNDDQTIYVASNGEDNVLYNTYTNGYAHLLGTPSGTYTAVSEHGSHVIVTSSGIYFVNDDEKISKAVWNSTNGWTYSLENTYAASVNPGSPIQVTNNGTVFYVRNPSGIGAIWGPNSWQHGDPTHKRVTTGTQDGTDLVWADDKLYYASEFGQIYYITWNGSAWVLGNPNGFATDAKEFTEMVYGDDHLFYVGVDDKIHYINGTGSSNTGVLHSTAPKAYGSDNMGIDYEDGKLVYFTEDRKVHSIYLDNGSWTHNAISYCLQGKVGSDLDLNDGYITYVSAHDERLHEFIWTPCSGKRGATTDLEDAQESTELSIYPNPVAQAEEILVEFPSSTDDIQYGIYNIDGKLHRSGIVSPDMAKVSISTARLPEGVYLLRWSDKDGKSGSQRFIVQ